MELPAFFKKLFPKRLETEEDFRALRNRVLFSAIVGLLIAAVLIILIDGYVFYKTFLREPTSESLIKPKKELSSEEIEGIVKILDEREAEFGEILGK